MSSLLFPVFRLSTENSQPENMYDIFLKRRKVFMQMQPSKGFFKKCRIRNLAEFTSRHVLESLFFLVKLNSIDLQLPLKGDSSASVFL